MRWKSSTQYLSLNEDERGVRRGNENAQKGFKTSPTFYPKSAEAARHTDSMIYK